MPDPLISSLLTKQPETDGGTSLDAESLETLLLLEKIRRMQAQGGTTPQSFSNALETLPAAFHAPGQQIGPFTLLPRGPSDFGAEAHLAQGILGAGNLLESRRVNGRAGITPSPQQVPSLTLPQTPPFVPQPTQPQPQNPQEISPEFVEYLSRLFGS